MADAAAVFVLKELVNRLGSVILAEQKMMIEMKSELEELTIKLSQIQAFLEAIEHRDVKKEAMGKWLRQLTEIIYKADDIVDSTLAEAARLEEDRSSSSCIIPTLFNNKHQSLISNIRSFRISQLKPLLDAAPIEFENLLAATFRSGSTNRQQYQSEEEEETIHYTRTNRKVGRHDHVVGRIDEIHTLIQYLSEELEQRDIISIMGMPGLGKTTLASMVYTDPRIQNIFPTRIWLHVSQDLDMNSLCRTILKNFTQQDMSSKSSEELIQMASYNLKMTRYLIVLDDVWTYKDWEQIKQFLPKSNRVGSKVLITTRNDKVARNASLTRDPYRLRMLCTEECFELLKIVVFGRNNYFPPELELVGRRIAKECKGLPLATLVLGGILMQQKGSGVKGNDALRKKWENLCDSIHFPVDNMDEFMEKILSLSYSKLPPRLRICFLYLGIFPEDYQIPARRLVLLWIAEGFIGEKPGKSLEETAEAYLNELINRNLLMVEKTSLGGKTKLCHIHDLIRLFCISTATYVNQNLYQEIRNSKFGSFEPSISDGNCRRLCIHSNAKKSLSGVLHLSKVRTLLFFGVSFLSDIKVTKDFVRALKMVRVLDGSIIQLQKFPVKLTQSVHLRYLTLSGDFEVLPAALTSLWNLQTLLVYTLARILEIKADIWELENLRHLQTNASIFIKKGKGKGGKNLQTISKLSPQSFTDDVSVNARNLKELGISGALSGSMCFGNLDSLEKLKLVHVFHDPLPSLPQPDSFPLKLKSLVLSSTKLAWDHMSTLENLINLEVLKLIDNAFVGESWDVVGGGFRRLESLSIITTNLRYWTASEDSFAELRILRIENCLKLEEVPLIIGKNLEVLHMYSVTKFAVYCARKIERECKNQGQLRSPMSDLDVQILHGNV